MMYNTSKVIMIFTAVAITLTAGAQTRESGIKMYNYGKLQSAERILAPLAATDALANYYLGLSYLDQGNPSKANEIFMKYPDDFANISGTARVAFVNKDVAKGTQIAKDLAAKAKKKDWLPLKYAADAITFTQGGDYNLAIGWYKDALTKTDDADVHLALGNAYRKITGGGGEAMSNYEHVTDKDANNSLAFSRIGDLWYDARNYQSALDNYAKAKNADSTNPLPYKALADAYARSGGYKLALQNIKRYMSLSDNTQMDNMEYLRLLYLAQSYCDAVTTGQNLLPQLTDQDLKTETYGIIGYSQAECGDSVQALKNLRTYLQLQKPSKILPGDNIQMGKLFLKLDMLDSAGYYYTKGISGDTAKNKTDVYRQVAEAFKAKKDYCKSAEWYNNLITANPDTQPLDYFWRGCMYYYCHSLDKSLSAFGDFMTKYPTEPSAIYWHGRAGAAIDSEAKQGTAVADFTNWLTKVGPDYNKKNDMKIAYQYLLLYYYNKKESENIKLYKEKIRSIDPKDSLLMQIDEAEKAPKKTGGGKK